MFDLIKEILNDHNAYSWLIPLFILLICLIGVFTIAIVDIVVNRNECCELRRIGKK